MRSASPTLHSTTRKKISISIATATVHSLQLTWKPTLCDDTHAESTSTISSMSPKCILNVVFLYDKNNKLSWLVLFTVTCHCYVSTSFHIDDETSLIQTLQKFETVFPDCIFKLPTHIFSAQMGKKKL